MKIVIDVNGYDVSQGFVDQITYPNGYYEYTGVNSARSIIAAEKGWSVKTVEYFGACIPQNINLRAHNGFPIQIDGVNVKKFLNLIAAEDECNAVAAGSVSPVGIFNAPLLSLEEFIAPDGNGGFRYNNFFFNFYNLVPSFGRNYQWLEKIDSKLAKKLAYVYPVYRLGRKPLSRKDIIFGHSYPKRIIYCGYKAYVLLRNDLVNAKHVRDWARFYNHKKTIPAPLEDAAFFS